MDLARIVVRVVFAWVFVQALVRLSGKRTVKQADILSFVVAVILGDMFDDLFWAEVSAAEFAVATATLMLIHVVLGVDAMHRGRREWRRTLGGAEHS
jgi:uncharacterized membrane protein YcaP (DUF421 family)